MRACLLVGLIVGIAGCSSPSADAVTDVGVDASTDVGSPDSGVEYDAAAVSTTYTYYDDIKPLVDGRCVNCHVAGGIGPFELGTYDDVVAVKELVASAVHHRTMPPFLPSPGCNDYAFDPSLTNDQIAMVEDWVAGGAPIGEEREVEPLTLPPTPQPVLDTELEMGEAYTPQLRPDDYRCFVLDWPHETKKYITGFGVEPGDARIVHHIIAFRIDPDEAAEAEARDAAEDGPGYTCFGGPRVGSQLGGQAPWLGSWAPGGDGGKYPPGTGLPVEPGSKVVVQVHYNTLAVDPVPDKTKVKFETADTVDKEAFFHLWASPTWLEGDGMKIPAGDSAVQHRFSLDPTITTGGRPLTLYSASIHMHLLGTSASTYVIREAGGEQCLVQINNYDFSWQGGNGFAAPVTVQPGDRLVIECGWDNSMANQPVVNGVQITPEDRSWGDGTTDEMCLGIYYATLD